MNKTIETITDVEDADCNRATAGLLKRHSNHLDTIESFMAKMDVVKALAKWTPLAKAFHDYELVIKYNASLDIAILDLTVITGQLYRSTHKWEKLFFAKQGYALLYTTIAAHMKFNRRLRKLLNNKTAASLSQYDLLMDELNAFKTQYGAASTIRAVYHQVTVHHQDLSAYYYTINAIDTTIAGEAASDFLSILNRLQAIITPLIIIFKAELRIPPALLI